jgi:PAS domain S-box-containing protein
MVVQFLEPLFTWPKSRSELAMKPQLVGVSKDSAQRFATYIDKKLLQLIDTVPTAMILSDPSGRIALGNTKVEQLFGYSRDELVDREIEILVPERFRNTHSKERAKYYADASVRRMGVGRELFARNKEGVEFPVEITLSPVKIRGEMLVWSAIRSFTDRERFVAKLLVELHEKGLILGGLISICAWCKQIQDTSGHWQNLERYIESHSQATFTHGICTDCLRKLDPASEKHR